MNKKQETQLKELMNVFQSKHHLSEALLTHPSRWASQLVCIQDCKVCPLANKGCADQCNRFIDRVCNFCPCANHEVVADKKLTFVKPTKFRSEKDKPIYL